MVEIECALEDEECSRYLDLLPSHIRARAQRYRFAQPRHSLVASQIALRECLLALGFNPDRVEVCPRGRPYLPDSGIEFNLSHSHQRAVLLMTAQKEARGALGVDLEWTDRSVERDALAKRFFTPNESEFSRRGAAEFFHVWTRKEAVLKTNGVGLRVPLDSFEVLTDRVEQKVTGRTLFLATTARADGYMVSWAVDAALAAAPARWIQAHSEGWLDSVREGIDS